MDSVGSLGSRIKLLRKSFGLTQEELGEIVGLHGTNIGRIEKDIFFPTADTIVKMAIYFNVSCDYLLLGKSANTQDKLDPLQADIINLISDLNDEELIELKSQIGYMIYKRNPKLSPLNDQNEAVKMA